MADLTWYILIDWAQAGGTYLMGFAASGYGYAWAGDGYTFDFGYASNEANRCRSLSIDRGRADEFSPVEVGKCTFTLDNYDRRYDPWYTSSPLYPNVLPRRRVWVGVDYAGIYYPLFAGKIEDPEPSGRRGQERMDITAYDGLRDLNGAKGNAALQTDITTDVAIAAILTAVGWSAADRSLDTGIDTLGYWWLPDEDAHTAIRNLVASEHGMFFINRAGLARFQSRMTYLTAAAAGTLTEAKIVDVALNQPWQAIRNVINVNARPLVLGSLGVLWTLEDDTVHIASGEQAVIWATYKDANGNACAGGAVVSPVITTDYTGNSAPGGTGTDLTDYMVVTATIYGISAKLTVTNLSTHTMWITLLQVRGQPVTPTPSPVVMEDSTSQTTYGKRQLDLDVPWQQTIAQAQDIATALLAFYEDPHKSAAVVLEHYLPDILQYDIGDRIHTELATYNIDETMRLGRLGLETINDSMQALLCTMKLEPADNDAYWILGTAGNSEVGTTTRLVY